MVLIYKSVLLYLALSKTTALFGKVWYGTHSSVKLKAFSVHSEGALEGFVIQVAALSICYVE